MELKKKLQRLITIVCVAVLIGLNINIAESAGTLSYGRISVQMPQIIAELKGTGYDASTVSALLGSESLQVKDVHGYEKTKDTVCTYILVDLSGSMRKSFELVKANINKYINNMGDNDQVVVITFGENEVKTILEGGESKEDIINTINNLQCNENGTMFYEALSRAYQLSNSSVKPFDREFVLVFSDGIDEQKGNSTYEEIAGLYKTHVLPIYAACSSNTSQDASDRFGELARSSGGNFSIITSEAEFDGLLNEINNVTLLELQAASNAADGQERQLSVKAGDLQVEQNIPISRSIADDVPPKVKDIHYNEENKSIVITFSESVNGALNTDAYNVTDEEKNDVEVSNVASVSADNAVEIKLKEIHNGKYTFTFNNITDNSQEANPLTETKTVTVKNIEENIEEEPDKEGIPIWGIILIILVVIVVVVLIIVLIIVSKKKKSNSGENKVGEQYQNTVPIQPQSQPQQQQVDVIDYMAAEQRQVKHHIVTNNAVRVDLIIKTGKNAEQKINLDIVSSVIVGRSDICDVCIDDAKLSRQHFVIENDNGSLFIMDLNSKNGTMLNGIRVNSRQMLHSSDKIFAGLSDMIIKF